jgi:hypothetical protein
MDRENSSGSANRLFWAAYPPCQDIAELSLFKSKHKPIIPATVEFLNAVKLDISCL